MTDTSKTPALPRWWQDFIQNVCEIPDRNSPEDEPEAMVATAQELEFCALRAIESCEPAVAIPRGRPLIGPNEFPVDDRQAFYATMYEYESKSGHSAALYDIWMLSRGLMTTDGRAASVEPGSGPLPTWVSVDDRLPHDPSKALVWYVPSKNSPHTLFAWFSGGEWRFTDRTGDSRLPERVTHWMPLPHPPVGAVRRECAPILLCMCKDRPLDKCPGEWEPGCDLGNNEKYVRTSTEKP